jgi:hypothetical protein
VAAQEDLVAGAAKLGLRARAQYNIRDTFITLGALGGRGPGAVAHVCGNSERMIFEHCRRRRNNLARRWWRPDCSPVHYSRTQLGHLMAPKGCSVEKRPELPSEIGGGVGIELPTGFQLHSEKVLDFPVKSMGSNHFFGRCERSQKGRKSH